MNITLTLTDKQQAAFNKRRPANTTDEAFATSILQDQTQAWWESDYLELGQSLILKLKDQPQTVLNSVTAQLEAL